jgi:hypothetical protein
MVITGGADERVVTSKLLVVASCIWSVMTRARARARLTDLTDGKIAMVVG